LTILYIHIPLKPIKILSKNVGYAREYPGTTVGPSMRMAKMEWQIMLGLQFFFQVLPITTVCLSLGLDLMLSRLWSL